jgi:hypothetical protein
VFAKGDTANTGDTLGTLSNSHPTPQQALATGDTVKLTRTRPQRINSSGRLEAVVRHDQLRRGWTFCGLCSPELASDLDIGAGSTASLRW